MGKLILIILIIHILVCLILFVLRTVKIIKCEYITVFIAFFVPVFGEIMLIRKRHSDRHSDRQADEIDIVRPVAEEDKRSIVVDQDNKEIIPLSEALVINDASTRKEIMMDILYNVNRSIIVDDDELKEKAVPLEEALVINDVPTRRNLIMDVLYTDPGDYVAQLNNAKENSDTEVVHYAATALAEIQKDFDIQFHDIMKRRQLDPEDKEIDNEYQILLENYISSGLLEGDALRSQLVNYSKLLARRLEDEATRGRWSLINKKAEADLKLRDLKELDKDIEYMEERWPLREKMYVYKIQSAVLKKDSESIRKTFEQMKSRNVHMSLELKSIARFWNVNAEGADG